jgi:dihydrodipicolinate synthase/N-acetylneuraminate lyase
MDHGMHPIPNIQFSRKPKGISAAYLPWKPVGKIDFESYQRGLERTWACGLSPAINMDPGFANLLSLSQRQEILQLVSELAAGRPFVAGAFVEDLSGNMVENYRSQVIEIRRLGGIPIVFQCSELIGLPPEQIARTYSLIGESVDKFLGFELGKMFAPFGSIYSLDTFRRLMDIPSLEGLKHSSLSRCTEWDRLACRDRDRPDFGIYTGNDLAIDMIQWGSDYLLGLSAFYPEAFAKRDDFWAKGDARFYELNDALQMLGGFAFRPPVPAYKHNAAMVLAMRGVIDTDAIPPNAPGRPTSDREFLQILIDRIDALMS